MRSQGTRSPPDLVVPQVVGHEPDEDGVVRARTLLAELLTCSPEDDSAAAGASPAAGTAEVMLDLAMDGWRYQLLRSVPRRQVVSLSSRELEIARMIANGHTNRTVAVVLDISPWTVSTHLRRVFAKLNVGSRAAMVARLVAEGLIVPPNGMGRTSR
jgi:DNA-binding CsgD family transcriptional regulator